MLYVTQSASFPVPKIIRLFGENEDVIQVLVWIVLPVVVAELRSIENKPAGKAADVVAITLLTSARIKQKVILPVVGSSVVKFTTTLSVVVLVPLVQLIVKVVEVATVGYHEWPEPIGPPVPESAIPESPVGEVRMQAVLSDEVQLYENWAPSVIVTGPSEPLILISTAAAAETESGIFTENTIAIKKVVLTRISVNLEEKKCLIRYKLRF